MSIFLKAKEEIEADLARADEIRTKALKAQAEQWEQRLEEGVGKARERLEERLPHLIKDEVVKAREWKRDPNFSWGLRTLIHYSNDDPPEESFVRAIQRHLSDEIELTREWVSPDPGSKADGDMGHDGYHYHTIKMKNL